MPQQGYSDSHDIFTLDQELDSERSLDRYSVPSALNFLPPTSIMVMLTGGGWVYPRYSS